MVKLSGRDVAAFCARPDPARPGILIHGADAMRVALKRQELIAALIGPRGADEMLLTRIAASELRQNPSAVGDASRAIGFFPGPRAVLVEDAGDGAHDALRAALGDWVAGDAMIVVTAAGLTARSRLRKLFEGHPRALSAAIYDDPPDRAQIEAALSRAGLNRITPEALRDLETLGRALDPGEFGQLLDRLALYKLNDPAPLDGDDIARLAPVTLEAEVDDILTAVAQGDTARVPVLIRRLEGQGIAPVALMIAAGRHFRALQAAACDPGGPGAGLARLKPPVFGPRRDAMLRQAQAWGRHRLETAAGLLLETDLMLRSAGQVAPQMALVERLFIRLAMLARQR